MTQKIVQVGNSIAITIPSAFAKEVGLKAGQSINLEIDSEAQTLFIRKADMKPLETPEVKEWLEKFNKKYKKGLSELAKR